MAWIFVFSPNIGWGNALLKSAFGIGEAPVNIYSMLGMAWALSSHYFPLAYLALGEGPRLSGAARLLPFAGPPPASAAAERAAIIGFWRWCVRND